MDDKKEVQIYLNHLKMTSKDLYGLSCNNSKEFIQYEFLYQKYKVILDLFPEGEWSHILNLLDDCIRDLSNNVNFFLSLYSIFLIFFLSLDCQVFYNQIFFCKISVLNFFCKI